MKNVIRFLAAVLAIGCFFSFLCCSYADLQSGREKFGGVSRQEADLERVRVIYDDLIVRAYEFDEDLLLPELEHMLDLEDIKYKYIQGKRGMARGQSLYEGPYSDSPDRWYAKDGCLIKVYARYNDYYFCELFLNEGESEGTIGWVPTTYTTNKWSASLSRSRTVQYSN